MIKRVLVWGVFLLSGCPVLHAQNLKFFGWSENDYYIPRSNDRYYTNGIGLRIFGIQEQSDHAKIITSIGLGQKIYTPSQTHSRDRGTFDRPYCGWTYLEGGIHEFRSNQVLMLGFDAGLVGRWSGGQLVQQFWHRIIQTRIPAGWEFQIPDQVAFHVRGAYTRRWLDFRFVDLSSESQLQLGLLHRRLGQSLLLRLGVYRNFYESAFVNADLQKNSRTAGAPTEVFFFFQLAADYVPFDGTINGLAPNAPHILSPERLQWRRQVGIFFSHLWYQFSLSCVFQSPETALSSAHAFGSVNAGIRF